MEATSTRERLVEAATRLFAQHGYAATSIRDIADAAGCNLALISHYFGSKDGLLREAVRAGMRDSATEIAQPRADAPHEQLASVIALLLERFDAARDGGLPIVAQELMRPDSPFAAEFAALARANVEQVSRLLASCKRRGLLQRDIDPDIAAVLLIGMLQIYFIARPVTEPLLGKPSPELVDELRAHVTAIFSRGVLRRKGTR